MKSQNQFRKHLMLLFSLLFLGASTVFAQDDRTAEVTSDTTTIVMKNRKIIIIADEDGKRVEVKEIKTGDADEEIIIISEGEGEAREDEYEEVYEYDEEDEYDEEREYEYDDDDYDYEHKKKKKRGKKSNVDLLAFDLGLTNYYSNNSFGNAALPGSASMLGVNEFRPGSHVALHFLPTTASILGRGAVNLKTAITIDWTNLYFNSNVLIEDQGDVLNFGNTNVDLTKNKLTARYVQMPLLLNINTDPGGDDGLSVSFGVYGGVLWKAWTKQVHEIDGQKVVDKAVGDYQLNPIRYGLMGRVDFKWFDIYAMYSLTNLFVDNQMPQTQTFVAGVNIVNF